MQCSEERRRTAIAKDLTRVALPAFGEFFVQALFAFFESARESCGCDEESQQENCPRQSAQPKDDRADEGRGVHPALTQAVGAVGDVGDDDCEQETEQKLHCFLENSRGRFGSFDFSFFPLMQKRRDENHASARHKQEQTFPSDGFEHLTQDGVYNSADGIHHF